MTTKKTPEITEQAAKPENNDCFIIMPIADHPDYKSGHFKRVYEDIFKPACEAAGYRPVRADDVAQTNLIQLDILQKLLESPMAICDLSTRNPNVLFELGLRQAFDKPTILVQEEGTPAIFDISMFRYTTYSKILDYRQVLADQERIKCVLEETRNAVGDGKSINSVVKLLSITEAKLEDTSNFGEKEYFQVLMSEIKGIKDLVNRSSNSKVVTSSTSTSFSHASTLNDEYYHLRIDRNTLSSNLDSFCRSLLDTNLISELRVSKSPASTYITLNFRLDNPFFGEKDILNLASKHQVIVLEIDKDSLPF